MAGFSEEQLELLHAAFEHLWQRSADLHEDLNGIRPGWLLSQVSLSRRA
jgi:hypothetical protein